VQTPKVYCSLSIANAKSVQWSKQNKKNKQKWKRWRKRRRGATKQKETNVTIRAAQRPIDSSHHMFRDSRRYTEWRIDIDTLIHSSSRMERLMGICCFLCLSSAHVSAVLLLLPSWLLQLPLFSFFSFFCLRCSVRVEWCWCHRRVFGVLSMICHSQPFRMFGSQCGANFFLCDFFVTLNRRVTFFGALSNDWE